MDNKRKGWTAAEGSNLARVQDATIGNQEKAINNQQYVLGNWQDTISDMQAAKLNQQNAVGKTESAIVLFNQV